MIRSSGKHHGIGATLKGSWYYIWRFIVTGLLVWVPLIITAWVSWVAISSLGFGLDNLGRAVVLRLQILGERFPLLHFLTGLRYWPGMGLILAFTLFFVPNVLYPRESFLNNFASKSSKIRSEGESI